MRAGEMGTGTGARRALRACSAVLGLPPAASTALARLSHSASSERSSIGGVKSFRTTAWCSFCSSIYRGYLKGGRRAYGMQAGIWGSSSCGI